MAPALVVIAAMLIPHCAAQSQATSSEPREQAERIWEQMIASKGGRDRLYQVETMVQESREHLIFANPKFPNGEMRGIRAFRFPDREWDWTDSGKTVFGSQVISADVAAGLGYIGFQDGEIRRTSQLGREEGFLKLAQLVFLGETRWLRPKPVRVLHRADIPSGVDAIETMLPDERVDFWIGRTDHLPVRIIDYRQNEFTHVTEPGYTYELAHYREIDGIEIPETVAMTVLKGAPEKVRWTTSLNPRLREDLFTTPPRFADGPDAWKLAAK
jgi:hypothetical protein